MSNSPDYITRTELQRMVDACDPSTLAGKRDRLLLVVLRALNGRSGEVAGLRVEDVYYGTGLESGGLVVRSAGEVMEIPCGEFVIEDPAALMDDWVDALSDLDTPLGDHPLFCSITKDGRFSTRGHPCDQGKLTPWAINQIVKRAAARAGLDNPERYTARIMRGPVRRRVERSG